MAMHSLTGMGDAKDHLLKDMECLKLSMPKYATQRVTFTSKNNKKLEGRVSGSKYVSL